MDLCGTRDFQQLLMTGMLADTSNGCKVLTCFFDQEAFRWKLQWLYAGKGCLTNGYNSLAFAKKGCVTALGETRASSPGARPGYCSYNSGRKARCGVVTESPSASGEWWLGAVWRTTPGGGQNRVPRAGALGLLPGVPAAIHIGLTDKV
jgi:hypothetical protein